MLKHTQKIREMYEDIQRKLYYMIPEKWDKFYLYASVVERLGALQTGELFFYYIPKGILKRKPINVYQIPAKFNIDEEEYSKIVELLYNSIKSLREEFKQEGNKPWSNITISIEGVKFKVEYNYDILPSQEYNNDERHIIWKYKYLKQGMDSCNRDERKVLQRYFQNPDILNPEDEYEAGIYIKNIKNIVDYETAGYESIQNAEYVASKDNKTTTNQILYRK
ncbi:MAG: antitoxin YezG family protein [Clostridia bacterium]|nr:antitoxin YezG family protein [Clostridia bacterium]